MNGKREPAVLHYPVCSGKDFEFHPNQKPVNLLNYLISKTKANLILDPFLGSGTTAVAAAKLGRRCIGIEINKSYLDIAVERLRQMPMNLISEPTNPIGTIDNSPKLL